MLMKRDHYNISAAYNLADSARAALGGRYGGQYVEDLLDADEETFWRSIERPHQWTLLHSFLQNWERSRWEDFDDVPVSETFDEITDYLRICGIALPKWFKRETIDHRIKAVSRLIEAAAPHAADAAFQLLFQDRTFLLQFQDLVLRSAKEYKPKVGFSSAQLPVRRLARLPSWLHKGVFHRDRGRCQQCGSDISGLLNLDNIQHYDHLLPLAQGGSNDPTNFQLLCLPCNLQKGGRRRSVANVNRSYW